MILGDRQSHYKDCHILHDGSRGISGSTRKGYLSKGYGLPARTLRVAGTAHNSTPDTGETFLTMEDFCCFTIILICRIERVL